MKKQEEPDVETMLHFMVPFIQLVDIGIKNGKTPKEVADYLTQLFQELSKNLEKIGHE